MTPPTKEAFYYRMIFEQHFPSMSAVCTVPQVVSIACSTAKAIEWDESFKTNADESGRALKDVHNKEKESNQKTTEDAKQSI
jgi:asparagine synthase (glutamine-hydrolysing)